MGKWGKYLKHYNRKWESEPALKHWLEPSSEKDVLDGKPEAYCKLCNVHIRAHHSDLVVHAGRDKHKAKENAINRNRQRSLHDYGCVQIKDEFKVSDLKLSAFIAAHCAIKNADHLGEIIKDLGKGSKLENTRLHRTKCSKLITNVIAPAQLTELLKDVGDSPYALIVDESTDVSVKKFMAVCIRYHSKARQEMITDFLGIVEVVSCTGEALAGALMEYLHKIKLPLQQLQSVGTDGASNMCGVHNSFFTHLTKKVPHLVIIKCICHSLDKCAEWAYKKVPSHLDFILSETYNWLACSPKRWGEYTEFYKTKHEGKKPAKLLSLSTTRWLIWLPVSSVIVDQWTELCQFFREAQKKNPKDFKLSQLAKFYQDDANVLYLTFLRTILKDVSVVNQAFEHSNADVTKLYSDLRNLVYAVACRILKERAAATTTQPGVLRVEEIEMLKAALTVQDNLLPIDMLKLGDGFKNLVKKVTISEAAMSTVHADCGNYLIALCNQLIERLPPNLDVIKKLQYLSPRNALAKLCRPQFEQLPLDLDPSADTDVLESQWITLGTLPLHEICNHPDLNEDINSLDIVHFWTCVLECKTATGNRPFEQLAKFALRALTIPVSNAVVERVFSFMSAIKTKVRNRMEIKMLEALLRLRVHLKAIGQCCRTFNVTRDMIARFSSAMYESLHDRNKEASFSQPTREAEFDFNPDDPDSGPVPAQDNVLENSNVPEIQISNAEDLPNEFYVSLMEIVNFDF